MTTPRAGIRFAQRYGPVAVVTGASSGIGRALAVELAARGVDLVLVARRVDTLRALAAELEERHDIETTVVPIDLARSTGVAELAAATAELDVGLLVAAAGFGTSGPFIAGDLADELDMLAVNCTAVTAQAHYFAGRFDARGRGGIILLSSIVGFQGMPLAAHYAATKAYVQTLGEALHVELSARGVDVLAAAPGPTASGFGARAGMNLSGGSDPADLAAPILDSLGRRPTALPGPRAKVLRTSLAPLPRRVRVRIMGRLMASMTHR